MHQPVTVSVDAARATARLSGPLVLGNSYAITFSGLPATDSDAAAPEVVVLGAAPGVVAARSETEETETVLALDTQQLVEAFDLLPPPPPPPRRDLPPAGPRPVNGAARPHGAIRLHFYVLLDGATLAQGDLTLLWAPFQYDESGEPIQLQGKKGDKGDPGEKGDKGDPGRNGVYVPMAGLYAFHVSDQGDHEEDGHLWMHAQDDSTLYAKDANGNYLLDENNERIPLYYIDADGHLKYRLFHGDATHAELDLGRVVSRTGLYALHVADGTVEGEIAGHLYLHGQDLSELYATNAQGERILDPETGEPIPLFTINASGHLIYTIYTSSGEVHATLDIGDVRGPKGDAPTFDDLTEEQKAALKGPKGDPGDPLTWDDLTPEQKAALRGPEGDPGKDGKDGMTAEEIAALVASTMGEPDDYPTAGSSAWVHSGGLWSVEQAIIARINDLRARIGAAMSYRGTVATVANLPAGAEIGDVYNVAETGDNYAWTGSEWDKLSGVIDLSGKQDVIADLATIRSGAAAGATAYQKPASGIQASDLAPGVIPAGKALVFATYSDRSMYFTFNGVKYNMPTLNQHSIRIAVGPPGPISFNFFDYRSDSRIFLNGVEINTTPTSLAAGDCCEVWFISCLALDTSILMADGTDKTLEKICVGDMLKTPFGPDMVVGVSCGMGEAVDTWLFDDGTEVRTIGRHRFWNDEIGEPVYLEAWKLGEHAIKPDGSRVALVGHDHFEIAYPHKTLVTKNYNLYYANALLAGNRKSVRNGGSLP